MKLFAAALDFRAVAREFGVPETFAPEVHADAAAAADRRAARRDLRDVPFVTIDPPGSMDLDQAMHISAWGGDAAGDSGAADAGPGAADESAGTGDPGDPGTAGWRVLYAIADVGGLVAQRDRISATLAALGYTPYESWTNFVLFSGVADPAAT